MSIPGLRFMKFKMALKEIAVQLGPEWKWELTIWNKDGDTWKINPKGVYQSNRSSIMIEISEVNPYKTTDSNDAI